MTKKSRKTAVSSKKSVPKMPINTGNSTLPWLINQKLHLSLLVIFAFLLYANTLTNGYALDDAIVIEANDFTQKGISGIGDLLSNDTFLGYFKTEKNLVAGGRYRPLSLVTFAIEYQFFGLNPTVSHLVNTLLYALSGIVLYLLVLLLFKSKTPDKRYFLALATTILFLAHPIHTEAVANIKGRDEIMVLLGSLATLFYAVRYFDAQKIKDLVLTLIVFFLALLSKENAITFLAVIPAALFVFRENALKKSLPTFIGLFIVAGVFLVIRSSILGNAASLSGTPSNELMNNPFLKWDGAKYVAFTAGERLATIFYTLLEYLRLLLVPHPLTHDYYPRQVGVMTFGNWQVIVSLLLYVAAGGYALFRVPKKDPIAFGILYFIATLSIVSNLIFPIGTLMGERFIYMPSVGFCLIVAVLLERLTAKKLHSFGDFKLALPLLALVLVGFSAKTILRNPAWKDNYTLFATDINTSTQSAKLNNAMGGVLIEQAQRPENANQKNALLQQALGYCQKAVEIHPTYANPYVLMGNAYVYLGSYQQAIEFYDYVLSITGTGSSDNTNALQNKAFAYSEIQRTALERQDFQTAINAGLQAITLGKNDPDIYGRLGAAYGMTNQHAKAVEMFTKVIELSPNYAQAYLNLGYAFKALGDEANGELNIRKAYELDPSLRQ